jgi:hypothetical protein
MFVIYIYIYVARERERGRERERVQSSWAGTFEAHWVGFQTQEKAWRCSFAAIGRDILEFL